MMICAKAYDQNLLNEIDFQGQYNERDMSFVSSNQFRILKHKSVSISLAHWNFLEVTKGNLDGFSQFLNSCSEVFFCKGEDEAVVIRKVEICIEHRHDIRENFLFQNEKESLIKLFKESRCKHSMGVKIFEINQTMRERLTRE